MDKHHEELNLGNRKIVIEKLNENDSLKLAALEEDANRCLIEQRVDFLLRKCAGLEIDKLVDYQPGEIMELWNAILWVNRDSLDRLEIAWNNVAELYIDTLEKKAGNKPSQVADV